MTAVLRVVEIEPGPFGGQALAAVRIACEEVPQVDVLDLLIMRLERLPFRTLCEPCDLTAHGNSPGSFARRSLGRPRAAALINPSIANMTRVVPESQDGLVDRVFVADHTDARGAEIEMATERCVLPQPQRRQHAAEVAAPRPPRTGALRRVFAGATGRATHPNQAPNLPASARVILDKRAPTHYEL